MWCLQHAGALAWRRGPVCACAGAAKYLHTYIHTHIHIHHAGSSLGLTLNPGCFGPVCACTRVCWYRRIFTYIHTSTRAVHGPHPVFPRQDILFCFWASVHESILFFACPTFVYAHHHPPSSPTLLRIIMFPIDPPFLQYIPHHVGGGNIV